MNLKNLASVAMMSVVMLISSPLTAASVKTGDPASDSSRAAAILQRVTTIQDMNIDELTTAERKTLKKEVKGYQKEVTKMAADSSRGVYLSVGAIIIIILLLILIL